MLKQKKIIISRRCGRLANRMILFATFVALAEECGASVANPTFDSYAELFETTRRDIYCRYPPAKRTSWMDAIPFIAATVRKFRLLRHLCRFAAELNGRFPIFGAKVVTLRGIKGQRLTSLEDPAILKKIQNAKIIFAHDWGFRADRLVEKHADKIRNYFRPLVHFERMSHDAVGRLRSDADVVVGVHIRHGDYRRWKGGKLFFPASRYAGWMREMAAQFPGQRVAFLVCSDEPRDAAEFPGLTIGFGTPSSVADLYALAKCDYIIGPPSTFSQWASFYGSKPLFHLRGDDAQIKLENFQVSLLEWLPPI